MKPAGIPAFLPAWFALLCLVAAASPAVAQFPPTGPGPGGPGMMMPPVPPGQDWWVRAPVYRSKYYNIKTDLEAADARAMAEHMDATFESYWGLFSRLPIRLQRPATLDLYLFATEQDYMNVLAMRFGNDGAGSWGKCITRGNSISLVGWKGRHSLEGLKQLVQHEGFHQVSSQLFRNLPIWADEGLAETFERGIVVGDRLVLGEVSEQDKKRLQAVLEAQAAAPLDQFLAMSHEIWNARVQMGAAQVQYLQAWSLVHFLIFAEEGKYETGFLNFLVALNRGADWRQAFVASFGLPDFKAMETAWLEYVRDVPPADYRETLRRLDFLAAGMTELRRREIHPTTLAELRTELAAIGFEHESNLYGEPAKFSARDARLFQVPHAAEAPGRRFVLVEPTTRPAPSRTRPEPPPPPSIVAEGLYPQVFQADWDRRGKEPGYVISSRPAAQRRTRPAPAPPAARDPQPAAPEPPGERPVAEPGEQPDRPVPPDAPMRTWTSADGKFATRAVLLDYADGVATLRKADGDVIQVRREQLSEADRQVLDRWTGK
jgi:hypothetical protein